MNDTETNELKQMALDAMIKAIDDAMKQAEEKEEHARQWIEQDVIKDSLSSCDIVNKGEDIKEARIIQRALFEAYNWMQLYLHA